MPSKREISASELAKDIRAGMTEADLMKKYGLSSRQLQKALAKVRSARKAKARQFLADVRAGMPKTDLMRKYRITLDELVSALQRLARMKAIREEHYHGWEFLTQESVGAIPIRIIDRCRPTFQLPIFEKARPENSGLVIDLTEKGVGIRGIQARADEIKTFIIPADEFSSAPRVQFDARCCWTRNQETEGGPSAGFEITDITERPLLWIRKFIRLASGGVR